MDDGADRSALPEVAEGDLLWSPSEEFRSEANITKFIQWLRVARGLAVASYQDLWTWSVSETAAFWEAVWDYFEVASEGRYTEALVGDEMPGHRWFAGSRVNYAEHVLRQEGQGAAERTAFHHCTEIRPLAQMSWAELGRRVRRMATSLRCLGLKPGDRVVSYMPNVPETAIAMLATVAIGGVWASAAPEFGAKSVIERFSQIEPKLIFAADGYAFGGRTFDRRAEIEAIVADLPTLERVVWLPYLGLDGTLGQRIAVTAFDDLMAGADIDPQAFGYERVGNDHPLWILFSSGTTGIPKAIVHTHVGVLLEHLKLMHFHVNLKPHNCLFFFTTTGWMMWNFVIAGLLTGATAVLYDGSPVHPGSDVLWRLAEVARVTHFGVSPTLVQLMKRQGVRPSEFVDTGPLQCIFLGGAPVSPEVFNWFYTDVKRDVWVTSQSGGTELCSALVGGIPTQPVFAGEIQGRCLGMDVSVWDDAGRPVLNRIGEMVVKTPFPSMPIAFWGDAGDRRYRDTYFSTFPGAWRHGDRMKLNDRGGCYIYGRSDATLNRHGVRIGTAEIYRVLEHIPGIKDGLVICCELPGGDYYMPLFIALEPGANLTEELCGQIRSRLRSEASPRHVPDEIHAVEAIPYTLTGKKMEVPVRRIVMGASPNEAASRDATANPQSLDWFINFATTAEMSARRGAA